jgi:hypothetical protein
MTVNFPPSSAVVDQIDARVDVVVLDPAIVCDIRVPPAWILADEVVGHSGLPVETDGRRITITAEYFQGDNIVWHARGWGCSG